MRIDTRPRRKNSGRQNEGKRFPSHRAWIRKRRCIIEGRLSHICEGQMEAAHVDSAGGKGMGMKVDDRFTIPACSAAHQAIHRGARSFEAKYGIDLVEAAKAYAKASPHRFLWEGEQ